MGMYDTLEIENNVQIEEMSIDVDPHKLTWQTKTVGPPPSMRKFKISNDGKLLRKETIKTKRSDEEMDKKAREEGYESWDDWVESDTMLGKPYESNKYKVESVWWANHNMHGELEFHTTTRHIKGVDDYYVSYEATFTKGELDEIMLVEERDLGS